jgi:hypothetical protein
VAEGIVSPEQRRTAVDALEASLRPLMPVLLAYGVSFAELLEMLQGLFVTAIAGKLKDQGRPTTVARLALMAGMSKGLIERVLRDRGDAANRRRDSSQRIGNLANALSIWHDDPRFCTPYGAPLDLSLQADGGFRSFEELVRIACPGGDVEAVLDELVASGCVEVHEKKFVRCTSRVYIPLGANVERIARLGQCSAALNSTTAYNLLREEGDTPFFERVTETEFPLSSAGRDRFLQYLREDGWSFLDRTDRWMTEHQSEIEGSGRRCGVSVFFFEVPNEPIAVEKTLSVQSSSAQLA